MSVTSRHLCHILLAKSKSHIPCALKKRGVNARRWGSWGASVPVQLKKEEFSFLFSTQTLSFHTLISRHLSHLGWKRRFSWKKRSDIAYGVQGGAVECQNSV